MAPSYKRLVTMQHAGKSPREVLTQPVTALLGVGDAASAGLRTLNIETVFDLAASGTFRIAAAAAGAVLGGRMRDGWFGQLDRLPLDAVDSDHAGILLTEAAEKPIEALRTVNASMANDLQAALTVKTVRDLGLWPPYHAAKRILAEAYALPTDDDGMDPEAPPDLVPGTGRYPTERVQYQVVVLDEVLTPPEPKESRVSLLSAGPIDVTRQDVHGFSSPAIGAVLTYTQSWFTEGLTLGQLLHTVALAPGESTRIAMIDWSRRTSARVSEAITQTEALDAGLTRTRSISEVVNAVANESQSGFSAGAGIGASTTTGSAGGAAVDLTSIISFPFSLAAGASSGFGMGASAALSYATSGGTRDINAVMTQNITDSTHQNASSTRNRWATVVREVSQAESERVSTRSLTNFNHMHALSVEYYEVVQLYRTVVELARVDRCLFVPMRIIQFKGTDAALRFRPVIAAAGLIPEVRGLAYADPDTLLFTAPNRSGPWSSGTITNIEKVTGVKLSSNEPALPLDGTLDLHGIMVLGDNDLVVTDIFDAITIVETSGTRHDLPIQTRKPEDVDPLGQYRVFIKYNEVASGRPPYVTDLRSVTLHKKSGKEDWKGTVNVTFRGYWHTPNATEDDILWLTFPIRVKEEVSEVTVGNFAMTLGEANLIRHLEENALHYSQAIWRTLDGATLGHLLNHYTIDVSGTETPLAHVLNPVPLGATGNYLIFRMPSDPAADKAWARFLEMKGLTVGSRQEDLVPLPSGGVFAEAVLGRFNAAEKLDLKRFWNWQDSPIPITAPEIAAIQTESRAQPEPVEPGQLGAPVVNIQNAPGMPDPQGLTAILQALASGTMFRDMSGLQGTQQLVRAFLEETMRGAIASAEQAGKNMGTAADFAARMASSRGQGEGTDQSAGGAQRLPATPSNMGALSNAGQDLDRRESDPSEWAQWPSDGDSGLSPPPLLSTENERAMLYGTKPTPKPTQPREIIITVRSTIHAPGDAGDQRLDGKLTIGFGRAGAPGQSEIETPVLVDLNQGVATVASRSLRDEAVYSVRARLELATGTQQVLTGLNLGVPGLDVPKLAVAVDKLLALPVDQVTRGTHIELEKGARRIALEVVAEMRRRQGVKLSFKADGSLGFHADAGGSLNFDSSKLAALASAVATLLKEARAKAVGSGIAAALSLFTLKTDFSERITGDWKASSGMQIEIVPAYLASIDVRAASG